MNDEPTPREAFEKWITAPPFELGVDRFPSNEERTAWPGHYRSYKVQLAWEAWEESRFKLERENAALQAKVSELRADAEKLAEALEDIQSSTRIQRGVGGGAQIQMSALDMSRRASDALTAFRAKHPRRFDKDHK